MEHLDRNSKNVVYRHRRLDTGEIFYIGVGKKGKRAYAKNGRSLLWRNIVNKYGYKVEIIVSFKFYEDALNLEKAYIAKYGRLNLGTGPLVNLTDGGEGSLGVKCSEETRAKLSVKSKEMWKADGHRDKISQALKGRKVSPETVAKIIEAQKGKKCPTISRVVLQFDLEGNYLNTFDSTRDAARKTGTSKTGVAYACGGKRKSSGGYIWKYKNEINN